jgi:hypothetical protein
VIRGRRFQLMGQGDRVWMLAQFPA